MASDLKILSPSLAAVGLNRVIAVKATLVL